MTSVGQELLNVPFAEMVLNLAKAIAEGQYKLDMVSCEIAKMMGDKKAAPIYLPDLTKEVERMGQNDKDSGEDTDIVTSMIGAGFQPTFYQFTDTIIEVKMAITMTKSTDKSVSARARVGFGCFSASVNASYSSKYSYTVEGSSLLRTKITPVPPNPFMQRMLDMKAQIVQASLDMMMKKVQAEIDLKSKDMNEKPVVAETT